MGGGRVYWWTVHPLVGDAGGVLGGTTYTMHVCVSGMCLYSPGASVRVGWGEVWCVGGACA